MASIIKIHEAKTHLSRIVEEVAAGPIKAAGREKISPALKSPQGIVGKGFRAASPIFLESVALRKSLGDGYLPVESVVLCDGP
jgi:hypothetical protein